MKYILLTCFLSVSALGHTQNHADCDSAFWIGTNYLMHFIGAYGEGADQQEADPLPMKSMDLPYALQAILPLRKTKNRTCRISGVLLQQHICYDTTV